MKAGRRRCEELMNEKNSLRPCFHSLIKTSCVPISLTLMAACRDDGIMPLAGCWYYNHASKKTLEAAGMVTATRLLRFEFQAR
jgi:hypothetical protein